MNTIRFVRRLKILSVVLLLVLIGMTGLLVAWSVRSADAANLADRSPGTSFTYQGVLSDGDAPAKGPYDLRFRLYDVLLEGSLLAPPVFLNDVAVSEGLFTADLDFGQVFDGSRRFLELSVRPGQSNSAFIALSPRQALAPVPYSIFAGAAPWDGLTGVPADIADGDDDTTYGPGFGLSLENGQYVVNNAQIQERVTGTCSNRQMVQAIHGDGTVTCATDTNNTYGAGFGLTMSQNQIPEKFNADTTVLQQRISGGCTVGQTIAAVNQDGTVVCQDLPKPPVSPRPLNGYSPLDLPGDVGQYTAITIGSDGLPLISYYDVDAMSLKVAHCDDLACNSPTNSTLDGEGAGTDVGLHTDITIGVDGLGLISYYDQGNEDLKVAHCQDLACTSAGITTIASDGDVGQFSAIAIGSDGLGLISYYDASATDLKVAHCENVACSATPTINTVDDNGDVGRHSAITIGMDGLALISYYDLGSNRNLKVAHCDDITCAGAQIFPKDIANDVGLFTSITIGADGLGLISYVELASTVTVLNVLHCGDIWCQSNEAIAVVDTLLDSNQLTYNAVTIGSDGLGLISYYKNGDLKVAHCSNITCSSTSRFTLDSAGSVGEYNAIATGPDGLAYISYYRSDHGNLKLARTILGSGIRSR